MEVDSVALRTALAAIGCSDSFIASVLASAECWDGMRESATPARNAQMSPAQVSPPVEAGGEEFEPLTELYRVMLEPGCAGTNGHRYVQPQRSCR